MVLAFRLYGDFHWPPLPEPAPHPATKSGTIEIHYAPKGGGDLHAFLRWVPKEVPGSAVTLPNQNIHRISDAAQWFVDNEDHAASIWIDEEVPTDDVPKVAFRGAFLIDQYDTDAAGEPRLDLRLPLVTACAYRKNTTIYSELIVERNSGSAIFRFNLHVPLPVRRTTLPTARNHNPASFPFCVVYPTRRPADKILDFTALVGGWIGASDVQASFDFDRSHLPKPRRLGRFGFAALAAGAGNDFAAYEGNRYPSRSKVDPFHFWPQHSEAFVHDVLSRSGFAVPPSKAWLKVAPASATDLSLRFRAEAGGKGELIYRMRVVAAPDPDKPENEDIRSFGGLALRLAPETGGWLRTAAAVHVECALSWEIPDGAIFQDRATGWKACSTIKLLWDEEVAPGFAAAPDADGILFAGTLAQAAHSLTAARKALQATEGGQPQSFLPDLVAKTKQTVRFALYAPRFAARFLADGNFVAWGRPEPRGKAQPVFLRPRMRLSLAGESDLVEGYETPKSVGLLLKLDAEQQSFFTGGGIRCAFTLSHDGKWRHATTEDAADGEPFFASFALGVAGPKDWRGRLSSLQFARTEVDEADRTPVSWATEGSHYLRVAGPGARYGMGHGAAPINLAAGYVAALLRIIVPLSRAEPVAVDVARTDRSGRPAPLLIPQDRRTRSAGLPFHLQVTESISPTQDRLLELDLLEDATDSGTGSYVMLSQEPFSLMRFSQRPLGDRGDLASASVAFYSSDVRVWQFRRVTDLYHYMMAPQVTGESADKPRRLEIHDLPAGSPEMPPRPFVTDIDKKTRKPAKIQSGLKRRAVEFRLAPSAEIWVRPSDVERGYFMPESSSYEIFRQRGEYGLGAALAFVRAEFLYGMAVGIDVAKERSVARLARVAEIEALTGRTVGDAREQHADPALRGRWNGLSRALARRPERLEVWARDPDMTVDFTPGRFSDGVSFALRATALHRAPLKALENATDYDDPPKGGRGTAPGAGKPRYHPQGLGGGALWPVESVNLFEALLERPESRGGAIEAIAFSPLGGDATQKAEFLNGIVSILSETRNGFADQGSPCETMKSDAVGMIRRKQMLIRSALSEWTDDARAVLPDDFLFTTKAALIEALLDRSTAYIEPHFREASQDVGRAGEGAEKARAIILDLDSEFEAMVARTRQRIEQFAAGYDRDKPWSAGRIRSFHAGLRACTGNVAADISALIGEARQRFASELGDASQAIGGYLAKALGEIAQRRAGALSDLGSFADKLELHAARAALDRLAPDGRPAQLDAAIARIDAAIVSVDGAGGIDGELKGKVLTALKALRGIASDAKTTVSNTRKQLDTMEAQGDEALDRAAATIASLAEALSSVVTALAGKADEVIAFAKQLSDLGFDTIAEAFKAIWPDVESAVGELAGWIEKKLAPLEKELADLGKLLDFLIASALARLDGVLEELRGDVGRVEARIAAIVDDVAGALKAAQLALAPQGLLATAVREKVLRPALEELLRSLTDADLGKPDEALAWVRQQMRALGEAIQEPIGKLSVAMLGALDEVSLACGAAFEGVDKARSYLQALASDAENYLNTKAEELKAAFDTVTKRIEDAVNGDVTAFIDKAQTLLATVNALDHSVRGLQNDLARSTETARIYGERAFGAASRLTAGGPMAVPSNVLKLYSAVTSAPELAALKADIDRIRSGFDELSDIIDTTETTALFNRLGDELKALGLSLPFDRIGDRLLPSDLSKLDIGAVFRNLGGANLDGLFKGFRLPAGARDAIKVSHDFDKAQARAWVQVDINAPMPGRRSLFSLGPFSADFVDMALTGRVRLEASKDEDRPTESGFGRIDTSIDIVVGGQSMLRFDKFALAFTREKGLEIEFDPKSIRLNPSFKFIQDFLSTLFPDEIGGLKLVKRDGVPIGIEHEFSIPPLALNFGTSGISNISIENRFKLLAYPDFMLANRFNLSTVERPFIFSIFIIGGTGYIQVDAEYRPFDSELMVAVEAGAGGSASLAFAVGPFSGQVFITLSGVLSYRKVIGRPGGGLSIASVLVIAGHVNVAGIATVGIVLMLRMTYRDNGQIDADGTLAVTIRISRFFKFTARAGAKYKLRDGKAETAANMKISATENMRIGAAAPEPEFQKQAKKLQDARS